MVRCMAYDPDIAITLWPGYFDINRTRSEGRRLPKGAVRVQSRPGQDGAINSLLLE